MSRKIPPGHLRRTPAAAARGRGSRSARDGARRPSPLATASWTDWCAGSNRRLKPIWNGTPAASTSASARSTSARSSETGFSQKIALPARAAAATSAPRACRCSCRWRPRRRRRRAPPRRPAPAPRARRRRRRPSGRRRRPRRSARRPPRAAPAARRAGCRSGRPRSPRSAPVSASRSETTSSQRPDAAERSSAAWTDTQAERVVEPGANGRPLRDRVAERRVLDRHEVLVADPFALPGTNAPCGGSARRPAPSCSRSRGRRSRGRGAAR